VFFCRYEHCEEQKEFRLISCSFQQQQHHEFELRKTEVHVRSSLSGRHTHPPLPKYEQRTKIILIIKLLLRTLLNFQLEYNVTKKKRNILSKKSSSKLIVCLVYKPNELNTLLLLYIGVVSSIVQLVRMAPFP
jgi:hypothetical protein